MTKSVKENMEEANDRAKKQDEKKTATSKHKEIINDLLATGNGSSSQLFRRYGYHKLR